MKTKDLVFMALFAALYVVLEYVDSLHSIFSMPQGGRLSFSILAIIFASYFFGYKKAVAVTLVAFVVRFILVPVTVVHPFQFVLDYILAPGAYAFVSLFPDLRVGHRYELPVSIIAAGLVQYTMHNISGWLYYAQYYESNLLWGVLAYNASYVFPTMIVGFVVVMFTKKRLISVFDSMNRS